MLIVGFGRVMGIWEKGKESHDEEIQGEGGEEKKPYEWGIGRNVRIAPIRIVETIEYCRIVVALDCNGFENIRRKWRRNKTLIGEGILISERNTY